MVYVDLLNKVIKDLKDIKTHTQVVAGYCDNLKELSDHLVTTTCAYKKKIEKIDVSDSRSHKVILEHMLSLSWKAAGLNEDKYLVWVTSGRWDETKTVEEAAESFIREINKLIKQFKSMKG